MIKLYFYYSELNDELKQLGIPVTTENRHILINYLRNEAYTSTDGNWAGIEEVIKEDLEDGNHDFNIKGV